MTLYETFLSSCSKEDMIKLAYGERPSGIDTALPIQWVEQMRLMYPDFKQWYWVWDCKNDKPVNLLEKAHIRMQALSFKAKLEAILDELESNYFQSVEEVRQALENA